MAETKRQNGIVSWRCPSNIALIKYWGKHGEQLPNNASLSITLQNATTETIVGYEFDETLKNVEATFVFGKQKNEAFEGRVNRFLLRIEAQLPFLQHVRLKIQSNNNFPHSAGIASSASAFGSLALCICSIEQQLFGHISGYLDFKEKASYLARIGSGSACRSMFEGYTVWGQTQPVEHSSDIFAVPVNRIVHPVFQKMQDSILIVSSGKKSVSSSEGHALMENHPYAQIRYQLAATNLNELLVALKNGDMEQFVRIVEAEALGLHALMMLSEKNYILLKPNTLAIIEKVQQFRAESRIPVCFTLDAGPNIHLLYPENYREDVQNFIKDELQTLCEHRQWIHDRVGQGPVQLIND
jgi:diphosphomevalonate decarboxylase